MGKMRSEAKKYARKENTYSMQINMEQEMMDQLLNTKQYKLLLMIAVKKVVGVVNF